MANKLSMVFNCVVISLVLAVCLFYVPEAYCTDELYKETVITTDENSSYFIFRDGIYWLYIEGELVIGVPYIPEELADVPLIEEK